MFAGERFDIVIAATQPVGSYWIRTRGEADCIVKRAHQEAILRYQGSNNSLPQQDIGFEAGRRTGKVHEHYSIYSSPRDSLESFITEPIR